jgi:hypothetical protein
MALGTYSGPGQVYRLFSLLVCLVAAGTLLANQTPADEEKLGDFSGLYRPSIKTGAIEWYAGAWLAPKRRFLEAHARMKKASFLEVR